MHKYKQKYCKGKRGNMAKFTIIVMLAAICGVMMIMIAVKIKAEWLLNVCMRGVLGAIAIFFVNSLNEPTLPSSCAMPIWAS